jgi:hypothetical protein
MARILTFIGTIGLIVLLSGEAPAGGRRGGPRGSVVQRYWRPSPAVRPFGPFYSPHGYYPYSHFRHDPRSIIVITPRSYYPYYYAPFTVVTSDPFYCHVHHVGFISRVGFLDHISGTHKIPLETADAICADGEESCIIEGY